MKHANNPIFIPFKQYQWLGGPATFMQNLRGYLDQRGFSYSESWKDAKVIFFPNAFDLEKVKRIKEQGGYVIQRLDGIYYPSKHGDAYREQNRDVETIYRHYADTVVFQSEYSREQCFAMFGARDNYQIIINGVDTSMFSPAPARTPQQVFKFITTGRFRNLDMLAPVIQALDMLAETIPFELTVIGPVVNPELEPYLQRPYLRHLPTLALPDIAEELRQSDVFLYSHLNPPCPNSVVEAISCGLPVVGFHSGAMAELCFFAPELLAEVSDEIFQRYDDFHADKLAEKIALIVEQYAVYRERTLQHAQTYSFERCGQQYQQLFDQYLRTPRNVMNYSMYCIRQGLRNIMQSPRKIMIRLLKRAGITPEMLLLRGLLRLRPQKWLALLEEALKTRTDMLPPAEALRLLFDIESRLYRLEGQAAIRYGNGVHTKHKHLKYHDFFTQRIEPGSRVLDVGCGIGALAYDIATQVADASVYGIDINARNIETARSRYAAQNIEFVCGNALCDLPEQMFDVIALSNVLEHIEQRVEFLQGLQERYHPKKFLIREPIFERDWRIPLQAELGIDYRLDPTHHIEYRQHEFAEEMEQAGLEICHRQINWGEIWAELRKKTTSSDERGQQ